MVGTRGLQRLSLIERNRLLIVLKRASWFTTVAVGSILLLVLATKEGWEYPEDYLPPTLIATAVTFVLFRIAIWVVKGFFHKSDG